MSEGSPHPGLDVEVSTGHDVEVSIAANRLHVFDPAIELVIGRSA